MKFAEKLKKLMKQQKLTQKNLAKMAGIGQSVVSEYTTGKYEPTVDKLEKLAKVFNVSPYALMSDIGDTEYIEDKREVFATDIFRGIFHNDSEAMDILNRITITPIGTIEKDGVIIDDTHNDNIRIAAENLLIALRDAKATNSSSIKFVP